MTTVRLKFWRDQSRRAKTIRIKSKIRQPVNHPATFRCYHVAKTRTGL
jgi:hypothetical protein